jgi:hypothetical protein
MNSVERKLRNNETEALELVSKEGIAAVMTKFNIKTRDRLVLWLRERRANIKPNPIADMQGGEKNHFLKEHRSMILEFCQAFGDDFTLDTFNIGEPALYWLKHGSEAMYEYQRRKDKKKNQYNELFTELKTVLDRMDNLEKKLELQDIRVLRAEEAYRELTQNQHLISNNVQQFSENTARIISKVLLQPLIQRSAQPAIDNFIPVERPDFNLAKLEKAFETTRKEITPEATNPERITGKRHRLATATNK